MNDLGGRRSPRSRSYEDPEDDLGKPETQRVRVLVRPVIGPKGEDVLEELDPTNDPNYPRPRRGPTAMMYLRKFASDGPVLIAEYTHRRLRPQPVGNVTLLRR